MTTGVELLLGSDIGRRVLRDVSPGEVARVITREPETADLARSLGIPVAPFDDVNGATGAAASVAFSVHYPVILRREALSRYRVVYNLHPGLLPWGRGYYPVFWAIYEGTPAGASIHEISEGVDAGPVVLQEQVEVLPWDTGQTLLERVRDAEVRLFEQAWPQIFRGERLPSAPQASGGSFHRRREFVDLKTSARVGSMKGDDLLRLVRAMTVNGHTGFEVELGSRRFHCRLEPLPGG